MKRKKIILIDGNSLVYRAFYALPTTLAIKSGQVTNAVYGFTSMLIKLFKDESPNAVAVAFDSKEKTFRHQVFKEYKAHRPKTPDELISQLPLAKKILQALNIPIFEVGGFEADDILATLARQAEKKNFEVEIVTGDKDALQLISDKTKVVTTKKGITDIVIYDEAKLEERYGLKPQEIVDMLGLKGDPSDNIPGVPGIGEKTAVKLIQEFGSLEKVLEEIDEVKGEKLKETLASNAEQAHLSKELATLEFNVPLEVDFSECQFGNWSNDEVIRVFSELEFDSLLKRLMTGGKLSAKQETQEKKDWHLRVKSVAQVSDFKELLAKLKKLKKIALTVSFEEANLFDEAPAVLGLACSATESYALSFSDLELLKSFLEDNNLKKVTYDAKFIINFAARQGVTIDGITFDVMVAAHLLEPGKSGYPLDELALKYAGLTCDDKDENRAAKQAAALFFLEEVLQKELQEKKLANLFLAVEVPLAQVLARMERTGVGINTQPLEQFSKELEITIQKLEQAIFNLCGSNFNINSPQQLASVLFEQLKLPATKKTKTGYSTNSSVLAKLVSLHPAIEKILIYRELTKLKTTYVDALPKLVDEQDKRLHTTFSQTSVATGRLSSANPNLQNIPIRTELGLKIREAFVPANQEDVLLAADYSQIELRLLAHFSDDKSLIKAFEEDKDIHLTTAAEVFGVPEDEVTSELRRRAKAVNFGLVYGMGPHGLAENLGISQEEAKSYIDQYFNRFVGVKEFIDKTIAQAHEDGYVRTILGRIRYLPELKSSNYQQRSFGERLAVNTPLQGSAADIIKIAMIRLDEALGKGNFQGQMVLQVHDELILEVPILKKEEVTELVRKIMEGAYPLKVRLKVDITTGQNWAQTK